MKGYKALKMYMSSEYGNMTYEIGKKYTITGKLKMCENGFHFCKKLEEIEHYYCIASSRIFEIEAEGKIIDGCDKSCAESITLMRELSKKEILQYFIDNQEWILAKDWSCRKALADQGICLDILVHDKDPFVRKAVAEQGYGLDVLVNDKCPYVREEVALQDYALEKLIHDKNPWIRAIAAEHIEINRLIG